MEKTHTLNPGTAPLPSAVRLDPLPLPSPEEAPAIHEALSQIEKITSLSQTKRGAYLALASENVNLALLSAPWMRPHTIAAQAHMHTFLVEALKRAQKQGEIWSPELDRISALSAHARSNRDLLPEIAEHIDGVLYHRLYREAAPASFCELLRRTQSARLIALLIQKSQGTKLWTPEAIAILKERIPPALDLLVAVHWQKLDAERQSLLLSSLIEDRKDTRNRDDWKNRDLLETQWNAGRYVFGVPFVPNALEFLLIQGVQMSPAQASDLLDFCATFLGKSRRVNPDLLKSIRLHVALSGDARMARAFIPLAAAHNPLQIKHLLWPASETQGRNQLKASISLWRLAARSLSGRRGEALEVLAGLAGELRARRDPEIRSILKKTRAVSIVSSLLEDAPDEEYASLFRSLAHSSAREAAAHLRRHEKRAQTLLSREDLLPLLQSGEQDIRLYAAVLAPRLALRSTKRKERLTIKTKAAHLSLKNPS